MKILALEFSSVLRSAAFVELGSRSAGPTRWGLASDAGGRATRAFGLIDRALAQARATRDEVSLLALGLGPGSYTGIRAAISLAQGWHFGKGVGVMGVSSIDCLAAQLAEASADGRFAIAVDAQRGEFYLALGEVKKHVWHNHTPLRLASVDDLRARAQEGYQMAGPDLKNIVPGAVDLYPAAATLARLAGAKPAPTPVDKLEPIYLRETSFVKAQAPRFGEPQ